MTTLVADCPRCAAKSITFDVFKGPIVKQAGGYNTYEIFGTCRHCAHGSVHLITQRKYEVDVRFGPEENLNSTARWDGFVTIRNGVALDIPNFLPEPVLAAFKEACECLSVGCWNAAGAMFRTAIDLVTKGLLPADEGGGLNSRIRRDLGLRLPWLISNGLIARDLEDLSRCIREDGNDGAHAATLKKEDAEDLYDFSYALLDRLCSEPGRIREAEQRRAKRRATQQLKK